MGVSGLPVEKVTLGRDVTMGSWKILQYGEERVCFEKPDFQIAMLFQSSSYNDNGCSFDTYEGSIEDSGSVGYNRTSLSHQPTRTTKKQERISTKMMTIQDNVLTIATGEPLFSVDYPRVPVDC